MLWCYKCNLVKPIDEFDANKRHYQIKSRKGKLFSCKDCTKKWTLENLKAVRYNFENNTWVIHDFKTICEALKFLENER